MGSEVIEKGACAKQAQAFLPVRASLWIHTFGHFSGQKASWDFLGASSKTTYVGLPACLLVLGLQACTLMPRPKVSFFNLQFDIYINVTNTVSKLLQI